MVGMVARAAIAFLGFAIAWQSREEAVESVCVNSDGSTRKCIEEEEDHPLHDMDATCDEFAAASRQGLTLGLEDAEAACRSWAAMGECSRNSAFMHVRCQLSCFRRICMNADYDTSAHEGADALVASVRRALAMNEAAGQADDVEDCVSDPDLDHDELVGGLVATWQSGIPADAGCAVAPAFGSRTVVFEAVGSGAGGRVPDEAKTPLRELGLDMLQADVQADTPGVLANASHLYMHPVCFSRSRMRDVMAAVQRAPSLKCIASFRKPIELRRLNRTGFSLMCSVTNAPTTFTSTAPLFVYAKAKRVGKKPVWPNRVPACDRSGVRW